LLAKGKDIVPLVGARKRDRLAESIGALDVELGSSDLEQIERTVPPGKIAGTRYNAHLMGQLDSEKERRYVISGTEYGEKDEHESSN
jgi:hypothetical protein